jgi:hypothetical protein
LGKVSFREKEGHGKKLRKGMVIVEDRWRDFVVREPTSSGSIFLSITYKIPHIPY